MEEFKEWVVGKGNSFPVEESLFEPLLQEFAIYNEVSDTKLKGRKDLTRHNLGWLDRKLVYFRIKFKAVGIQHLEQS